MTTGLRASALLPFVPSGRDFDATRRLFADLGFEQLWASRDIPGFKNGESQFILQKYDVRSFAENFMITLRVPDLDAWWRDVSQLRLDEKYSGFGFRINPPADQPWGREVAFIDLAGVCWHVVKG